VDISDIRLANLKALIHRHAGGNVTKFAEMAGLDSDVALLHVTGPKRTRNLGPHRARTIERHLNLEAGWMDRDHSTEAAGAAPGDGGRTERALEFYSVVEKLPPEALNKLKEFIELLRTDQKKGKRRRKRSDSGRR